jgi:septal ring-binding cell division protein DamX
VIALQRPDKLHDFIRRHPEWAPFALFEQLFQGKPLWVMVQGDYPDVVQAREAARRFPTDLQRNDELWIRRFVMLQEQLN